ncbi:MULTISPECIES: hypothetical protein [Ignatzschineria]|nr:MULTISPECIES: hypothetical protein [Ignatzschineria]
MNPLVSFSDKNTLINITTRNDHFVRWHVLTYSLQLLFSSFDWEE